MLASLTLFTGCREENTNPEDEKVRACCMEAGGSMSDGTCTSIVDQDAYNNCMNK